MNRSTHRRNHYLYMILSAMLICLLLAAGCSSDEPTVTASPDTAGEQTPAQTADATDNSEAADTTDSDGDVVVLEMADGDTIVMELDPEAAPLTVSNFKQLVSEGFYDGLTFHRVIDGFMIQGGDPAGNGTGGSDTTVKGEFASNGWENPIKHERGVVSMARSTDPDSASSQFFIVHQDSDWLDGEYAAFGRVIAGMDEVDHIASVATDASDKPLEDVVITRAYLTTPDAVSELVAAENA